MSLNISRLISRFTLVGLCALALTVSGCSYVPWMGDDESEEDLAFEQEFGDENASEFDEEQTASSEEDDFFADDSEGGGSSDDSGFDDSGFDDPPSDGGSGDGGFSSVNQGAGSNELRTEVETLQAQQEALITRVRELQEIIQTMEPRLAAAQTQLENTMGGATGQAGTIQPDIEQLKSEVGQLNQEIARLKSKEGSMKMASASRSSRSHSRSRRSGGGKLPAAYSQALSAYRSGDFDGSILQFQEFSQKSPPSHLKDNILFWIGSNYFKLDMYDDAIAQFQSVIDNYPRGNKVHDSRYMMGVSYFKKGDRGRALDVLEAALKTNPPGEVRDKIQKQLMEIK